MVTHRRYIVYMLLILCSCNTVHPDKENHEYFSLKKYFHEQDLLLSKENISLDKLIIKDGKTEHKKFTSTNWEKELHPFADADINKPAWKTSYHKDSVVTGNEKKIIYTATEPKLVVRSMEINFVADTVSMINIIVHKENSYYNSSQSLQYFPGKGYSINGSQKVILADSTAYTVTAKFNTSQ